MHLGNPSNFQTGLCNCRGKCEGHTETTTSSPALLSRRRLLRTSVAGAALGVLGAAGIGIAAPRRAAAQSTLSPDAALQMLMDGNKRFVERRLTFFEEDLALLKANTAELQQPFASVLSCADSRVPVEILFDQSIGHVFINRVAGNIATSEIIASIEYGVAVLGTRTLMVLGHAGCGAVDASIKAGAVPGQISALYPYIRPAVDLAGNNLEAATKANAKIQANLLKESSPVIASALKDGSFSVVAAYYDTSTGQVSLLT